MSQLLRLCATLIVLATGSLVVAQSRQPQWILPHRSALSAMGQVPVRVTHVDAQVRILDRAAITTLEVALHNPGGRDQEAVLLLPVPEGAAVSQFAFQGTNTQPSARILNREEARQLYDEITARLRDPALLEFVGWNCLRSSVFPVPAGGTQKVHLVFEHVLEVDGDRVDYVLPRSEMLDAEVPWSIRVELQARARIGVCHSVSHELAVLASGPKSRSLEVTAAGRQLPGAFRLTFTTATAPDQPTATLFAYPDQKAGGGYFLLLANAPPSSGAPLRREVTIVLDRSGSMAGKKLEQAKAAALQVLEALEPGEGCQVLDYGNDVRRAFPAPRAKDDATMRALRENVAAIRPIGGTNIHDALQQALQPAALPGMLPLVLFLTDGLPTVGPTSEKELHAMVAAHNHHHRRVFCFGVGHDVNVPLLDALAERTRAVSTYVQPDEDVEVQVARTFARLGHPVVADPVLVAEVDPGATERLADVMPRTLPDLFVGDQLVVLGRYQGSDPLRFRLTGRTPTGERAWQFALPVHKASLAHGFVPRLWATRQIGFLVDELRQQGADLGALPSAAADPFASPRLRELRDEILRLSTRFGVLGEYTAFLATEGKRLDDWSGLTSACQDSLDGRAIQTRSGASAWNQGDNLLKQKAQTYANPRNRYLASDLEAVESAAVQQVCDRAFLRRGNRWIDGNAVVAQKLDAAKRVVVGSAEYFQLAAQLAGQQRAGVLALRGEILIELDGANILVVPPTQSASSLSTENLK